MSAIGHNQGPPLHGPEVVDLTAVRRERAEAEQESTQRAEASRVLSRLLYRCEEFEEQIREDPVPHINKLARENALLRAAVENAYNLLCGSGEMSWTRPYEPGAPPPSPAQLFYQRNALARDVLHEVLWPPS